MLHFPPLSSLLIYLYYVILVFGEECKLRSPSCSLYSPPPQIGLSVPLFSGTLGPCYSRRLRGQVRHPHRNGRKIDFMYLNLCVCRCETELPELNGSNICRIQVSHNSLLLSQLNCQWLGGGVILSLWSLISTQILRI